MNMNYDAQPVAGGSVTAHSKDVLPRKSFESVTPDDIKRRVGDPTDPIHEQIKGALYNFRGGKYENDAEDLYHTVLLKILRGAEGFDNRSKLSSWVYSIAQNTFRDFIRSQNTRNKIFDQTSLEDIDEQGHIPVSQMSATETEIITNIFLSSVLSKLSEDELRLLQMKKEGYSSTEIAKKFNVDKSTLTTRFGVLLRKIQRLVAVQNTQAGK